MPENNQILKEIARLKWFFPNLESFSPEALNEALVPGAEEMIAIPRWEKIADSYSSAVQKILDLISRKRKIENGWLGPSYGPPINLSERTAIFQKEIAEKQSFPDIIIIQSQFGERYRGRYVFETEKIMTEKEFGLGAYEVAIALLLHEDWLRDYDNLRIICGGDVICENNKLFSSCFLSASIKEGEEGDIIFRFKSHNEAEDGGSGMDRLFGVATGFLTN